MIIRVEELERKAQELRLDVVKMLAEAKSGHSAGALGMAEVFTALYFDVLSHKPSDPAWPGRDRLFLSNGHIAPIQYVAMAHAGYFPKAELFTLRKLGSRLQGHPEYGTLPGIENTSGPLGDGAGQSVGSALYAKREGLLWHTYCALSDGELQSGIVWESALSASAFELNNLTWIVDRNNIQIDGATEDIMPLEPLHSKFASFGFHVLEVDGHNIEEIIEALKERAKRKPTVIIAHTTPGKGVNYMENDHRWHGAPPGNGPEDEVAKEDQLEIAIQSLSESL